MREGRVEHKAVQDLLDIVRRTIPLLRWASGELVVSSGRCQEAAIDLADSLEAGTLGERELFEDMYSEMIDLGKRCREAKVALRSLREAQKVADDVLARIGGIMDTVQDDN